MVKVKRNQKTHLSSKIDHSTRNENFTNEIVKDITSTGPVLEEVKKKNYRLLHKTKIKSFDKIDLFIKIQL